MCTEVKVDELESPATNASPANEWYVSDIPYEALPEIPSTPTYDTLDFLHSESDYSSTKVLNRGFSLEKPDISQLIRFKRDIFNSKMKRRESELLTIPESRQLHEVLKQTVMWPVAKVLIKYIAPSNWASCFFCGGFVQTHCCVRSYKIVHGISFKC
jgi:hypothetical protein